MSSKPITSYDLAYDTLAPRLDIVQRALQTFFARVQTEVKAVSRRIAGSFSTLVREAMPSFEDFLASPSATVILYSCVCRNCASKVYLSSLVQIVDNFACNHLDVEVVSEYFQQVMAEYGITSTDEDVYTVYLPELYPTTRHDPSQKDPAHRTV